MTSATAAWNTPGCRPLDRGAAKRRSRAFGLLEVILVFAVVIGAAAAVFSVYQSARASSDASALVDQASMLAANLRSSALRQPGGYIGLTTDRVITAGVVPPSMVSNGTVQSAVGGQVSFLGNFLMPDDKMGFQMIYDQVPADVCVKFVQGAAHGLSPGYVLVNNEALQGRDGGISTVGAVDAGSSGQRCSENALNTVTFVSE